MLWILYNYYTEESIDEISKENITNIEYYNVSKYFCAKGPVGKQLNTLFDNCSDIYYLYNSANEMRYSVSMNDFPKDSLMNSLLRYKLTTKFKRTFGNAYLYSER